MLLKKCRKCNKYTLKQKCVCGEESSDAHYKFLKVRDAPKSDVKIVRRNKN